jgi:acetylornithine deacetylase/succinyl-diaminopimelate desuccinylase-like protein
LGELVDEVTELLQRLIRNGCVNDGSEDSGQEARNAATLRDYLEGCGCDIATFEPLPGRESLVARVPGSDPEAPSLMLMGHTDVVPANPDDWERDPFGGELVDGVVWGRGAVDMLNLTSSMAVAFRQLADDPSFDPRGDLVYFAVADEEAGGTWGAEWMVNNEPDAVRVDYVLTEFGGVRVPLAEDDHPILPLTVAEKGAFWGRMTVRGTAGHGSMPFRRDNALVTAAEVVRRIAEHRPRAQIGEVWRRFVEDSGLPDELRERILDPERVEEVIEQIPDDTLARFLHAATHTTLTPTMMEAGVKTNVICDTAVIDFDCRSLPGQTEEDVLAVMRDALGDLADGTEITFERGDEANSSPIDTPLWDILQRHAEDIVPGARNVPALLFGGTDSRHLRKLGATCYGYGAYSDAVDFSTFAGMFHGPNERIDQESLRRSTELWIATARDLLG